jgi:hypothetical protein
MALVLGSADLSDEQFLSAIASAELRPSQFRHADHLRLAWLQVRRAPSLEQAEYLVASAIRGFALKHGVLRLYHATITLAWVRLIAKHDEGSFAEFLRDNEWRLNRELLHRFWTPELLASDAARKSWVPPDIRVLPV